MNTRTHTLERASCARARARPRANTTGRAPYAGGPSLGRRDFFPHAEVRRVAGHFLADGLAANRRARPAVGVHVCRNGPYRAHRRRYRCRRSTVNQNPPPPSPSPPPPLLPPPPPHTGTPTRGNRARRRPHAFCGIKTPAARKDRVAGRWWWRGG